MSVFFITDQMARQAEEDAWFAEANLLAQAAIQER